MYALIAIILLLIHFLYIQDKNNYLHRRKITEEKTCHECPPPVVSDILSSPWCHACLDQNINQKPRNSPHSGRILPDAGSSNFP